MISVSLNSVLGDRDPAMFFFLHTNPINNYQWRLIANIFALILFDVDCTKQEKNHPIIDWKILDKILDSI